MPQNQTHVRLVKLSNADIVMGQARSYQVRGAQPLVAAARTRVIIIEAYAVRRHSQLRLDTLSRRTVVLDPPLHSRETLSAHLCSSALWNHSDRPSRQIRIVEKAECILCQVRVSNSRPCYAGNEKT